MSTETDDKLMTDAARLATSIAPERDLWSGIEAAIETPAPRRQFSYFAQAATVLLLVGASSLITWSLTRTEPVIVEVPAREGLVLQTASFGANHELGEGFRLARTSLRSQLDEELAKLSPESRAGVEENLQLIRNAITEINAALEAEPGNVLLQQLLLKTYREELAVMRNVGGLTQSVMSRNDI
tara:strand:- start:14242 stop:14793 length:552 start_codon:yes stop_codon:yes gene_type:complete